MLTLNIPVWAQPPHVSPGRGSWMPHAEMVWLGGGILFWDPSELKPRGTLWLAPVPTPGAGVTQGHSPRGLGRGTGQRAGPGGYLSPPRAKEHRGDRRRPLPCGQAGRGARRLQAGASQVHQLGCPGPPPSRAGPAPEFPLGAAARTCGAGGHTPHVRPPSPPDFYFPGDETWSPTGSGSLTHACHAVRMGG